MAMEAPAHDFNSHHLHPHHQTSPGKVQMFEPRLQSILKSKSMIEAEPATAAATSPVHRPFIPGLKELQTSAENARREAMQLIAKRLPDQAIQSLILSECLEAQCRNVQKKWCLDTAVAQNHQHRHIQDSYHPRNNTQIEEPYAIAEPLAVDVMKKRVRFQEQLEILGHADASADRTPIQCTVPSIVERLILRASRVFPHREAKACCIEKGLLLKLYPGVVV